MSLPTCDCDFGAFTRLRVDGKFVAETPGTAEAEPHALARGKAVLERLLDIGDPGPLVPDRQTPPPTSRLVEQVHRHLATAAIIQRVARQFARGGDDLGL